MKREIDMKQQNEMETAQEANGSRVAGDGIDRRNFLQCMAWAGTGLVWSMVAGVPTSKVLADATSSREEEDGRGLLVRTDQRQSYRLQ